MPPTIEQQGDALYNIFLEARPAPNRIRDISYFGAKQGVGYYAVNDLAWQAAMQWAAQFSGPSYGALITFNGYYEISQPITLLGDNVLIGGAGLWTGDGGSGHPGISTLKLLDSTQIAFQLGTHTGINLNGFTLLGSNGTNLNHMGIQGGNGRNIKIKDVDVHSFGGPGIQSTGGINWDLQRVEIDGCLKGYLVGNGGGPLASYLGALDLTSTENFIENCNINGPVGFGVTGQFGSGFACALNQVGSQSSILRSTFAAAQTGIRYVGILNRLLMSRPEGNQGYGILLDGVQCSKNYIKACHFNANSQDSNGGYPAIKVNNASQNSIKGNWIGGVGVSNLCNYFVDDNTGVGDNDGAGNEYDDNIGTAYTITRYHFTNPNNTQKIVSPRPRWQALTDGATVTPDAQQGDNWQLIEGGSHTIAAPNNSFRGQRVLLAIKNNTAGAITTTFNAAYKLAGAWVDPGPGKCRCIEFSCYDGTNYIEVSRSAADITAF